jgi:hypothetical protein
MFIDFTDEVDAITLHVKVPNEDTLHIVKMVAPPEPSKKPSVQFINALQMVNSFNLIKDSLTERR